MIDQDFLFAIQQRYILKSIQEERSTSSPIATPDKPKPKPKVKRKPSKGFSINH